MWSLDRGVSLLACVFGRTLWLYLHMLNILLLQALQNLGRII